MEFVAATKDGLIVYDASQIDETDKGGNWSTGKCTDGRTVKVLASMPCPPNAFGFAWSDDGALLASVCDEGVRVYDAEKRYKVVNELEKVAPDVQGRVGGVRSLYFSPLKTYLVTYEKWDPQYPENVHVWALKGKRAGERIRSCTLKGYTSGALPVQLITWTCDESLCLELLPGVGVVVHDGDLMDPTDPEDDERVIPEPNVANFLIAPRPQKDGQPWVAVYVPQSSMVARVSLYHLSKPSKIVMELNLPNKVKDCQMLWNFDGSALLANAMSDVDETGNSYFGSTYLYWLKPEDRKKLEVCGVDKGLVQDLAWSPCSNEFMVIVGMLPAEVNLYNGTTGKLEKSLGKSKRNTLKWNPFGRFAAVAGFGTLPGDLDFYDRSKDETVASLRAALTVDCSWFADGRHFMAATVAPRMNEGNQITVYKYTGDPVLKMEFKPDFIEGRHEDTGAGARTKTQALLFAARWRPDGGEKHQDRAASPPRTGEKRVKGLPVAAAPGTGYTPQANAYRPRNADSGAVNTVAAMMRGEVAIPEGAPRERTEPWEVKPVAAPLEAHEVRKMEKEAKKLAEQKEKEAKEKHQQALRELVQDEKDAKKRIKELKAELEELEKLKDKEWDELTEEDEVVLEGEAALRAELAALEKK